MAEIVNLRREKKRRARAEAAQAAAENRIRHGRTAAAKQNDAREATRTAQRLDGAQRPTRPDPPHDQEA